MFHALPIRESIALTTFCALVYPVGIATLYLLVSLLNELIALVRS